MSPLPPELIEGNTSLSWERPKEYRHWRRENNAFIASVGENTIKSLARSHPKVFSKHHSDLQVLEDGTVTCKEEE
jgi:hypothetical protein